MVGMTDSASSCWYVYMLECAGDRLYTGITPDVAQRFGKHCSGRGAAFTRINPPRRILAAMACDDRSSALKKESALKKLKRPAKLAWAQQHAWNAESPAQS